MLKLKKDLSFKEYTGSISLLKDLIACKMVKQLPESMIINIEGSLFEVKKLNVSEVKQCKK